MARWAAVLVSALVAFPAAADDWLPSNVRDGLAAHLVDELRVLEPDEAKRPVGARKMVDRFASVLEGWGNEATLEKAPVFERIELPPTDDATLRAIASYALCTLPLHKELAADEREELYVAMGEVIVVVVSAYLRDVYLEAGGTDQGLKDYLDSEAMNDLSYRVQASDDLRAYVNEVCGPTLTAFLQ